MCKPLLSKLMPLLGALVVCAIASPVRAQTITYGTHNYFTFPDSPVGTTYGGAQTGFIFNSPSTGLNHWQSQWYVMGQIIQIPDLAYAWKDFSYWSYLDSEFRGCHTCEASLFLLDPLTNAPTGSNLWNPIGAPVIGAPGQTYWNSAQKTTFDLGGLAVTPGSEYLFVYGPAAFPTTNDTRNGLNFITFKPNVPDFESGLGCFASGYADWNDASGPPPVPGLPTCGTDDLLYEATFATVPEPGTLTLLATGLLGLGRMRSRRRRA